MTAAASLNTPSRAPMSLDWLPPAHVMRRLDIADTGLVSDPHSGQSFIVSDSTATILKLAQEQTWMDDLLDSLCHGLDIDPPRSERGVPDFASRLRVFSK